ncbi:MAG TPA: rhomboid family intramembrane serine protease [Trueperaceae bacterium]
MTQTTLYLLVLAIMGLYSSRLMLRLAPALTELPLKTMLTTLLCGLAVAGDLMGEPLSQPLRLLAMIAGPIFILAPFALTALARVGAYGQARFLLALLYWTPSARVGLRRLMAQVALQQGRAERVLELVADEDASADILRAQAYVLDERWHDVLALPVPERGDNTLLLRAARAEAQLELDQAAAAEHELAEMERIWHAQGQGPLGYRAVTLTQARLAAARGDFDAARQTLQAPLPGVPPYQLFRLLARAAENSGKLEPALQLYAQAYALAPESQRPRLAETFHHYNVPLPKVEARRGLPRATIALIGVLVAAYLTQLVFDRLYNPNLPALAAGFLFNLPAPAGAIPEEHALWRYLSYAFVHANLLHIGLNSWVLFDIGRIYEARRHWGNLLAAFVIGAIMGAYFTTIATSGGAPLVGASAGVLGIAGALLADALRSRSAQDRYLTRALFQWIVIIVIFSLVPGVSLWGHVGGLIGGLLWGFIRQGLPKERNVDLAAGILSILAIALTLFSVGRWLVVYL